MYDFGVYILLFALVCLLTIVIKANIDYNFFHSQMTPEQIKLHKEQERIELMMW